MRKCGCALILMATSAMTLLGAPAKESGKPVPAPAAPAGGSQDETGVIEGLEIPRPGGGYWGLQILNNNFVLSCYNAKKKKVAPDVAMATMRWSVRYQPNDERAVLNPGGDGTSLTSAKIVKPPHTFKVFIGLFASEHDDAAVESYVVDYHE